ncbi:MAG: site-2 protease family protein [Kiritimatiellia bacterium]
MDVLFIFSVIIQFVLVFGSIVLHEVAHGYVAWRLGDPTARMHGRLTLNPLKHIDLFGTILLPLMLAFMRAPVLGWAKPVPINPSYFRDTRRGVMLTGAAGPLTNFVIALAAGILYRLFQFDESLHFVSSLAGQLFIINVYLGLFNLLPVPPLDGSRVLVGLIPSAWVAPYLSIERYGIFIMYGIILLGWHRHILDPLLILAIRLLGIGE